MNQKQSTSLVESAASMIQTGFASGHVIHHRRRPKPHRFKYQMCWCLFDLDNLDQWFGQSKLWGRNKWSVFSLYDRDYITAESLPIKQKLMQFIVEQTGETFNGSVKLFTHPRFLGYGFNSVNFYFCYQDDGEQQLLYIVSEINNTPWGEKHLYFHDCSQAKEVDGYLSFNFAKQFHISPFVEMQMDYRWNFKITNQQVAVKMWVNKQSETLLTVVLDTKITPFMENGNNRYLLKRPFQPWKMSLGIYWQAFKLWCKKVPFYDHPNGTQ